MDSNNRELFRELLRNNESAPKIIETFRLDKAVNKTVLSRKLDLTWAVVSNSINLLKENNILKDTVEERTKEANDSKEIEPKRTLELDVNPQYAYFAGVAIGSKEIKFLVTDFKFKPIKWESFLENAHTEIQKSFKELIWNTIDGCDNISSWKDKPKEFENYYRRALGFKHLFFRSPDDFQEMIEIVDRILAFIEVIADQGNQPICGIGFSFPGAVDPRQGKIVDCLNKRCLKNKSLRALINSNRLNAFRKLKISITMDNNANLTAVAERENLYNHDLNTGKKNIAAIYFGTSASVGLILNNRLYHASGELGHITAPVLPKDIIDSIEDVQPYTCACGKTDCLTARFEQYRLSTIINCRKAPDDIMKKAFLFYANHIINVLSNLLNLDVIVFSGKISMVWPNSDNLWHSIDSGKDQHAVDYTTTNTKVLISDIRQLHSAIGAAIHSYYAFVANSCNQDDNADILDAVEISWLDMDA